MGCGCENMDRSVNLEDRMKMELIDMENVRSFDGRDVLRIDDFNRDEITYVLEVARLMGGAFMQARQDLSQFEFRNLLEGKVVGTNFGEDSSRTHDSHVFAIENLGAKTVPIRRNAGGTSVSKGESLAHDAATLASYGVHAIVTRQKLEGSQQWMADYLAKLAEAHPEDLFKPVIISGGDGAHEHPTQAFLDLMTLYNTYNYEFKGASRDPYRENLARKDVLSGMTMLAVGDTLKGRTFRSLARALSQFEDNEVVIVSPEEVRAPEAEILELKKRGLKVKTFDSLEEAIEYTNRRNRKSFIYGLRTQEERLDPKVFEKVKGLVNVTPELLDMYEGTGILPIMHPLPMHKGHPEISPSIDFRKEAIYFKQMGMGQFARMALLGLTLGRVKTSADGRPYFDGRIRPDEERFLELPLNEHVYDEESLMRAIEAELETDSGRELLNDFIGVMNEKRALGDERGVASAYLDFFSQLTQDAHALDLVRHFTFRFQEGECGWVLDGIENGKTGLVKYHLDLSSHIGKQGSDGNPVIVSAVDGIDSHKYGSGDKTGLKGVIKVRGIDLELGPQLQYVKHLSRHPVRMTKVVDGKPVAKYTPTEPYELRDFIHCSNPMCVSREEHQQHTPTVFYHQGGGDYQCRFCDTIVPVENFKLIKTD